MPGATMRFKVEVEKEPSSTDAGVIAILPNGGALPGPYPNAVVVDSTGGTVQSAALWNNPREGFAIILASTPGPVWIYLKGGPAPSPLWTPDSPLHPSLLLYTRAGNASLAAARALADSAMEDVRMGPVPMIADAQNRFGPSDNFVSYYTGWLNVPETGSLFIGTISQDGSTVLIDGTTAANWPGMHSFRDGLTGKMGGTITLERGPHRIQYFQFTTEGSPMAQLIWRLPSADKNSLPQTPRQSDFLQSGIARITAAESLSGAPPAIFRLRARSYMNFADQFVDLFELSMPLAGQYGDATFGWSFPDGFHASGPRVLWPVLRGGAPVSVTLTVTSSQGKSSSTHTLDDGMLPRGARVEDAGERRDYAQALLNRILGAPAGASPVADWPAAFWGMLPQVVQGGEGKELLAILFQRCGADLANLSADDRMRLGDIYYDEFKGDAASAPGILDHILADQKDPAARFHWQLKAVDYALFEAEDIAAARRIAGGLNVDPFHGGKHDAEWKLIALGDIERMAGNLDAATRDYTAAQAVYEKSERPPAPLFTGFSGFDTPAPTPGKDGIVISAATTQDADWRKRAVLENTYYTEVENLLERRDYADAREKLDAWAIEFPLDRLGGDSTLAEAGYARMLGDYARAQRILKAYRIRVDLSAQLAEAMQMEWECDLQLQQPAEIKELATDILKRFPDLPLAREARQSTP